VRPRLPSPGGGRHAVPRRVRMPTSQLASVLAAAVVAAACVTWTVDAGFVQIRAALAFGALITVGELARITLPGGREIAPLASAGAFGYTFLLMIGPEPAQHSATQVVAVAALGLGLGALPHVAVGRAPAGGDYAQRLIAVAVAAATFRPLAESALVPLEQGWWASLLVMVLVAGAVWLVSACLGAVIRTQKLRTRYWVALRDELRAQTLIGTAIGASGILLALACSVMGLAALAVFIAPLLVTQIAFRRFAEVRRTYLDTVRALSRVTEVGGYVAPGHSRRVADLARAVGRELGMREAGLLELEYAALMHDIGQLSLRDPIPAGATVLAAPREQRRIAELGSAVIRETGVLDTVAELVRRQCEPAAGIAELGPPPLGSRVIKAVNAFDDLMGEHNGPERVDAVLGRLAMDADREYDPTVVDALAKVVRR
jgi:hypothetical protein